MNNNNQRVSLSFSKKFVKKDFSNSVLEKEKEESKEFKHSLLSFDKDTKLPEPTENNETLVIPLVESKRDEVLKRLEESKLKENEKVNAVKVDETEKLSLDEQAAAALILESNQKLEAFRNKVSDNNLSIQIPPTHPSEVDIVLETGDISNLEDYEEVNVEHFGAALLRGMGWSKDKGVGKKEKRVVEIVTPSSKGFGLTSKEVREQEYVEPDEEQEELKKGSEVLIHSGRNRGTYGIVVSIDEDHLLIRPSRGDKVLREVEQNIRVVSSKEYKELSRVINKEMYDEFKEAELKKKQKKREYSTGSVDGTSKKLKEEGAEDNTKEDKSKVRKREEENTNMGHRKDEYHKEYKEEKRLPKEMNEKKIEKKQTNEYKSERERDKHITKKDYEDKYYANEYREDRLATKYKEKRKTKYEDKKGRENTNHCKRDSALSHHSTKPVIPWARENLRVRIIDKNYKGGKYHKEKVIVSSVETVNSCTCIASDGKMLYDVNPDSLETVIPKTASGVVLVVKGNQKGQKGRILEINKEKELATIQLLQDNSVILDFYYDDICEYVSR